MAQKAPGRSDRISISLKDIVQMFPDDSAGQQWFTAIRWPEGVCCPHCGSESVQVRAKHRSMPMRSREKTCAKRFSVRIGTVMQDSNLEYQSWALAIYLLVTSLKNVSSMKLRQDLGIT